MDDKKFDDIRADMRHFGSWTVMLVVAEMAYPAPAFVPPHVPRASLKALQDAGLIELLPARMYRIKGLAKERAARAAQGKPGAAARWERNANGERSQSDGTPTAMPAKQSKDEQSKDETSTARDDDLSDDETDLFGFLAKNGAYIRPESGFGVRLLGLIDRRGVEVVIEKAKRMLGTERLSDRQWVFGLEGALEEIPSPPMDELPTGPDPRKVRMQERVDKSRLEYFQNTGQWDPALGPEPEWQDEWGVRPPRSKVAA